MNDDEAHAITHLSIADRVAVGKAAREQVSRRTHGQWAPAADRPDPVALIQEQATTRVPDLVPLRHGRMSASAFAFYRGAALIMAADLATQPHSGLMVQLCGDAHLANFGVFNTPERNLVFSVNDFDETLPGPFEWDVKRLAASMEIAARSNGFTDVSSTLIVEQTVRSYRQAMASFAATSNLDTWYVRLDVPEIERRWGTSVTPKESAGFQKVVAKAESKTRMKALAKLTEVVDGRLRFRSDPPLLVAMDDLPEGADERLRQVVVEALQEYRTTLSDDRRYLLETYRFVDLARKVVGVGSVGTRCWLALFVGRDEDDPLFLQIKEAEASVLERFLGESEYPEHGQRVVEGQRLMQASSDIFLGWHRVKAEESIDGRHHDYYVRQLWDGKGSATVETMNPKLMGMYGEMCGWTLARAHARSGDPVAVDAYLGTGSKFDKAMTAFARAYADQNDRDHQAVCEAIADGRLPSMDEPAPIA